MLYKSEQGLWKIEPDINMNRDSGHYLILQETSVLRPVGGKLECPADAPLLADCSDPEYMAHLNDEPWFVCWAEGDTQIPDGWEAVSLRDAGAEDEVIFALCSRAVQLRTWRNEHRFCGRCGHRTRYYHHEPGAHCDACGLTAYPRISPCVIILIYRGNEVLLARGVRHKNTGVFSTIAGFIEAGESAEQAVHREIREEVGVEVRNVRYMNSQTWPFPHQLMLGFRAEWVSGEIALQEHEILEARWFRTDDLPKHAPAMTIAGWLIREYCRELEEAAEK